MADSIEILEAEVDRIEPWLRRTEWAPMTYMMIPSVLKSADQLLQRIAASSDPAGGRREALLDRLRTLRAEFRRVR